jgi:glycosyltransferase involved in cell wall biosynthesis
MNQGRPASPPIDLVVPGPIETLTGGFIYDRRMAEALRRAGRLGAVICLEGHYPNPGDMALRGAARRLVAAPGTGPLVVDGLALTPLIEHGDALPRDRALIALIHHPLCDETGLSPTAADALFQAERLALRHALGCVVTSPSTGRRLADFGVSPDRFRVVLPGLDQPRARPRARPATPGPVRLLCVATLSPRKGQDILLTALAALRDLEWSLDLVGAARDPSFSARIKSMVTSLGLAGRVRVLGEVEGARLNDHYRDADIFVLPSYHEGFGMALSEAMAHGLAIVSTRAGAIPETVPDDAGKLVDPGDAPALSACLLDLISEPEARLEAGAAARRAAARMPSWTASGINFVAAVDDLLECHSPGITVS